MAEKVIVEYELKFVNGEKVVAGIQNVGEELDDLRAKAQAAFAGGAIESATNELIQQGNVVEALVTEYGSATKALKAMEKELQTMAALGQRNTKEFKQLAKATAELKDSVGDTRGEIRKMASDTRVFDTMVQGARGVAAAFSVATGLAASLGDENKDLQKTLLKVQGAMAALQGVQELANIATEKGGIATKIATAAQAAYATVVGTSTGAMKLFRVALAATGLGLAVIAITELVLHWDELNAKVREFLGMSVPQKKATEEQVKAEIKRIQYIQDIYDKEVELKKAAGESTTELELQRVKDLRGVLNEVQGIYKMDTEFYDFESSLRHDLSVKETALLKAQNDERLKNQDKYHKELGDLMKVQIAAMRELDKVAISTLNHQQEFANAFKGMRESTDEPIITEESVAENKTNADKMAADLAAAYNKAKADKEKFETTKIQLEQQIWTQSFQLAQQTVTAINEFVQRGYNAQAEELNRQKEKDLARAGDNKKKRENIEKRFAVESAKIERRKAMAEKNAALFSIVISLAQAIQKIQLEAAVLAANPLTASLASMAYAQMGLAIASSGIQAAVVASRPLPEVPKFEKGGKVKVLGGGRSNDGMLYGRSHREGGMLIEAQGGEYIWDIPTVKKHGDIIQAAHENKIENLVFHKYIAPQMKKGQAQQENYDDFMLRVAVKNSARDSADRIVNGIVRGLKNDGYLMSRYG